MKYYFFNFFFLFFLKKRLIYATKDEINIIEIKSMRFLFNYKIFNKQGILEVSNNLSSPFIACTQSSSKKLS